MAHEHIVAPVAVQIPGRDHLEEEVRRQPETAPQSCLRILRVEAALVVDELAGTRVAQQDIVVAVAVEVARSLEGEQGVARERGQVAPLCGPLAHDVPGPRVRVVRAHEDVVAAVAVQVGQGGEMIGTGGVESQFLPPSDSILDVVVDPRRGAVVSQEQFVAAVGVEVSRSGARKDFEGEQGKKECRGSQGPLSNGHGKNASRLSVPVGRGLLEYELFGCAMGRERQGERKLRRGLGAEPCAAIVSTSFGTRADHFLW